jgi:hypothetical protein
LRGVYFCAALLAISLILDYVHVYNRYKFTLLDLVEDMRDVFRGKYTYTQRPTQPKTTSEEEGWEGGGGSDKAQIASNNSFGFDDFYSFLKMCCIMLFEQST